MHGGISIQTKPLLRSVILEPAYRNKQDFMTLVDITGVPEFDPTVPVSSRFTKHIFHSLELNTFNGIPYSEEILRHIL